MRKVHHPKIVQRSDRRWMVVCDDCGQDGESATPIGINTPVESREVVQLLWENHCERRRPGAAAAPDSSPAAIRGSQLRAVFRSGLSRDLPPHAMRLRPGEGWGGEPNPS